MRTVRPLRTDVVFVGVGAWRRVVAEGIFKRNGVDVRTVTYSTGAMTRTILRKTFLRWKLGRLAIKPKTTDELSQPQADGARP